jgi:hypothetical protein
LHPYGIVIVDNEMKRELHYSKLIESCDNETDDQETYEIVTTLCEVKIKY